MASGSNRTVVSVPSNYAPLIEEMSSATGLPQSVIAAQANDESGFNATAVSPAGARGWLQFLPSTYSTYAAQAGVSPTSEFNPASEAKVYDVFMSDLLKQEHGSVRNALAAYNAGPGNLAAGYGYADKILGEAGQGSNITTTGFPIPGGGNLIGGSISGILGTALGDLRDVLERFGLILLGAALILVGIHVLTGGGSASSTTNIYEAGKGKAAAATEAAKTKPVERAAGTGAKEAVTAAAAA